MQNISKVISALHLPLKQSLMSLQPGICTNAVRLEFPHQPRLGQETVQVTHDAGEQRTVNTGSSPPSSLAQHSIVTPQVDGEVRALPNDCMPDCREEACQRTAL